ncbi:transcription elongation regulator 1-like [Glossina fuscipes fuscipes]
MVGKTISAKVDLKECKLITHKSIELVKDNPNHLKEIKDILKVDKRYLLLDYLVEEGTNAVLDYLEELQKCGPPPSPSASVIARRK